MMERDLETIEAVYKYLDRFELKSLLLQMSEDVAVDQSAELPWGGHHEGHQGVKEFFGGMSKHLQAKVILERLIDAGQRVVAVGRMVGKVRATDLEFDVPLVHVWTLREGLVVRLEVYLENATLLVALGS